MFQYQLVPSADDRTLILAGDLDTLAAQELDSYLEPILMDLQGDLWVDLEGLTYLNSTGIRSFVRLEKLVKTRGRQLIFQRASERILRIFRYCGMDAYFRFGTVTVPGQVGV